MPEGFEFQKNLPSAIIRTIIPILNRELLSPDNIKLIDYITDIDILELIFISLKELKSNKYNNYLYEIQNVDSPLISSIIFDKTNPLNLNISQISAFSGKIKTDNLDYIDTILNNSKSISIQDIYTITNQLEATGNIRYYNFLQRALPLVENKQNVFTHIENFFKSKKIANINEENNLNEKLILIYEEFIKTQTLVPLSVTQYFSAEIMQQHSLDCLEGPINDIKYFNFDNLSNLKTVGTYLTKSLDEGKIVNIEILFNVESKGFKFDSKDVTNNAYVLASSNSDNTPVPLKLSPIQPSYKPVRLPSRTYKDNEIRKLKY